MQSVVLLLGLGLCACGPSAPDDEPQSFIALASDFEGFIAGWPKAELGHHDADGLHFAGTRTIYVNRRPAKGLAAFPVGTLVVKVVSADDGRLQIFGMAKRGSSFNADGAKGWEWFELASLDGPPVINWRGTQPPASSAAYGGLSITCNTCHQPAAANDSVLTPELSLQSL